MTGQLPSSLSPEFHALRQLLKTATIGVVVADLKGRLLLANDAFCSILGWTEQEICIKTWTELSPPEGAGKEETLFEQLRAGSIDHFLSDKGCLRADGSLFVGHWSVWSLGNRESSLVLAMVTGKGQPDLAWRGAEEHFRHVADTIPVMIWTSDVDALCTYKNKCWLEFTRRPLDELLGNGWVEGVHPEERQQCVESYKQAVERREPFQIEYRFRRYDGEYRWVLGSGVPRFNPDGSFAGYIGSVIDVTELKHAVATVRESEDRFRRVANTAPVMIWMAGTDKLCTYFNQPWLEFTGRSLEAELGNGWAEGVHPEDFDRCLDTYTKAFDRRESFRMEYRLRRHDGEYRWVLDQGVPRLNADGSFAGYIGSGVDVTESKQAQEALSLVSRKLIDAQDEERARIARELHDDINQRLALLAVNLDSFQSQPFASTNELLQKLGAVVEDIESLSSDVQALSHRLHSPKLEILGLAGAAASFCREFSDRRGVKVDFQTENIPKELSPEVSLCLFRVLQEALVNAAKHSGSRQFQVRLARVADEIEFVVHDSGIGFLPEEAQKGSGLGLTSMKERLKLVGGELSIESQPHVGTTVRARVPVDRKMKAVGRGQ